MLDADVIAWDSPVLSFSSFFVKNIILFLYVKYIHTCNSKG